MSDPTTKMGGSSMSPAPLGGRRRRMTKKVKAMLKKMKLMGGVVDPETGEEMPMPEEGGRRRRTRRGGRRRRSRRHAGLFA